jgi:hypothetical protein
MANSRGINYFYPTAESTGYNDWQYGNRFGILNALDFSSVLDVGSGPCNLAKWLDKNKLGVAYEAVDIRDDALALCSCTTHKRIPNKNFDLVCLYGTVAYNIDNDKAHNKKLLFDLLTDCKKIAKKWLVFTVMKEEGLMGLQKLRLVGYTRSQVEQLVFSIGLTIETVHSQVDLGEYIVVCNVAGATTT